MAKGRKGAGAVLVTTERCIAKPECVYLGKWWGVVDYGVGANFVRLLAERGGGEFVATEADASSADRIVRWTALWAEQPWAAGVTCGVVREVPGEADSPFSKLQPGQDALHALVASGFSGPVRPTDADRVASARLRDRTDLYGGRLWKYVRTGDVDSGTCLAGDVEAVMSAAAEAALRVNAKKGIRLEPNWLAFATPCGDLPYGLEVTPVKGVIEAVRVSFDPEAFEYPDPYKLLAQLEIPTGRMVVSDPAYLSGPDPLFSELRVRPGTWVAESIEHEREVVGIRLRHATTESKA